MARMATVRSASLAPTEAALADTLAESIADGSFTELVRMMLRYLGEPLKEQIAMLRRSGIDPKERLFITHPTPPDSGEQLQGFYAPSSWPEKPHRRS